MLAKIVDGVKGFMKAAFGLRLVFALVFAFAFFAAGFLVAFFLALVFFAGFLAVFFFALVLVAFRFVAIYPILLFLDLFLSDASNDSSPFRKSDSFSL